MWLWKENVIIVFRMDYPESAVSLKAHLDKALRWRGRFLVTSYVWRGGWLVDDSPRSLGCYRHGESDSVLWGWCRNLGSKRGITCGRVTPPLELVAKGGSGTPRWELTEGVRRVVVVQVRLHSFYIPRWHDLCVADKLLPHWVHKVQSPSQIKENVEKSRRNQKKFEKFDTGVWWTKHSQKKYILPNLKRHLYLSDRLTARRDH